MKLLLTTGEDNFLKIRTFYKVLVMQIIVASFINYGIFLKDELSLLFQMKVNCGYADYKDCHIIKKTPNN